LTAWRALRADPVPWLLSGRASNLHWRVLTDLFARPEDSPAVRRARGAASVCEPVATLLGELYPDGAWATGLADWAVYAGPGWRVVAAVQWGADPSDPRLQAAAARLVSETPGHGGFALRSSRPPSPPLTARLIQTMARLGWYRDPRVVEAMAWLDEAREWGGEGGSDRNAAVTAVALLDALGAGGDERRRNLRDRAAAVVMGGLERWVASGQPLRAGYPNLLRTDPVEMLWALARAGTPLDSRLRSALEQVQRVADGNGRWRRGAGVPESLHLRPSDRPRAGAPSRWITLVAAVAVLRYAEPACLPRLFPERPTRRD